MHYVAFLRGMNLGGRRITNDALCAAFRDLELEEPWAFLASGNVAFQSRSRSRAKLEERVEQGLGAALDYDVPVFLRTAAEVAAIAQVRPFADEAGAQGGKLQVALLATKPSAQQRKQALSFATAEDQLAIDGQELYWLPAGGLTDSALDHKGLGKALGNMTVRTQRTLIRLAAKLPEA